eukprot:m.184087 g.184087  ORF g.184087 m.184087 type:complete len:80 (-) comp14709_c0_seq4:74-313(-)
MCCHGRRRAKVQRFVEMLPPTKSSWHIVRQHCTKTLVTRCKPQRMLSVTYTNSHFDGQETSLTYVVHAVEALLTVYVAC